MKGALRSTVKPQSDTGNQHVDTKPAQKLGISTLWSSPYARRGEGYGTF